MFSTLKTFTFFSLSNFFTPLRASMVYPTVDLPTLQGSGGTLLNGAAYSDKNGNFVAILGDVNGDHLDDFAIASTDALNRAGATYVFFGSRTGFTSPIDLSIPLNGSNGFVITGESAGDNLGWSLAGCDVNGDNIKDLVVTAPFAATPNGGGSGKVYVIFGKPNFNATIPLAMLNGNNGFVIYGKSSSYNTGYSVAGGDINGDGVCDLVFGAPGAGSSSSGEAYLIYGSNQTFPTPLQLSTFLNGTRGSTFSGMPNYQSGYSVTTGDVNGDGRDDIVVGSYTANNDTGLVSVILSTNTSFPTNVSLSAVNGSRGFTLSGESSNDWAGRFVATGDINGDGLSDIGIGAPGASPRGLYNAGKFYVIYGTRAPLTTTFSLGGISNGNIGFEVDGANSGDNLGWSIAFGDINKDGLEDSIIGAPAISGFSGIGAVYSILSTTDKVNVTVDLSAPGSNCLILQGGVQGENSGSSVASGGDINGDGLSDFLIGRPGASPYNKLGAGNTAVIFGDTIQLTNNGLTVPSEGSHILTLSDLNASVPRNPEAIQYTITQLQHGQFEYTDQPGIAIFSFSSQDIMLGRVKFIQDGSELAPSYQVAASRTIVATTPVPANVTFINELPAVVNNTVSVNQGQTGLVSDAMLSGTNPDNPGIDDEMTYIISGCSGGAFSLPSSFSKAQILNGEVYFTPYGANSPQCSFTMLLRGAYVGPTSIEFDFRAIPVLEQNHFDICQGQTKTVTSSMLSASQPGTNFSDTLIFSISNVQYGRFERFTAPGVSILSFSQADINNSSIQFAQDGSQNAPSFIVTVGDGRVSTSAYPAGVYFTRAPELLTNALALNQGDTVFLTQSNLNAINRDNPVEDVMYTVTDIERGTFIELNASGRFNNITQFPQSKVAARKIAFKSDDSANVPSYNVVVLNRCSQSVVSRASVDCNLIPAIFNNQLTITDGQPVILNLGDLSATDDKTPTDNLGFTVSNVTGGHFELTTSPEAQITVFSGASLRLGQVRFIADSGSVPAYNVSVSDGVLSSQPQSALVTLKKASSSTIINTYTSESTASNTLKNALISFFGVTVPLGIAFWLGKRYLDNRMNNKMENILKLDYSAVEKADEQWKKNTIFPVLKEVFKRIQTATGCCGYRDEQTTRGYIIGVEKLLGKLKELGVNINLNELPEHERNGFKSAIADEIQKCAAWGKPSRSVFKKCCAALFSASPGPVFTPRELQKNAIQIAEVIAATYKQELSEDEVDRIRRPIYEQWTTRPAVKEKPGSRGRREAYLELADLSGETEQKFASEWEEALIARLVQIEAEVLELKRQKEQNETNHDGRLVPVGSRAASKDASAGDVAVTIPPQELQKVRVA